MVFDNEESKPLIICDSEDLCKSVINEQRICPIKGNQINMLTTKSKLVVRQVRDKTIMKKEATITSPAA